MYRGQKDEEESDPSSANLSHGNQRCFSEDDKDESADDKKETFVNMTRVLVKSCS